MDVTCRVRLLRLRRETVKLLQVDAIAYRRRDRAGNFGKREMAYFPRAPRGGPRDGGVCEGTPVGRGVAYGGPCRWIGKIVVDSVARVSKL